MRRNAISLQFKELQRYVSAAHIIIQVIGEDVQNEGNIRLHFLRIPVCMQCMALDPK